MDDNKVAVLLEQLSSQFIIFGEGLSVVQKQISEVNQKVDGLIEDMDVVKPSLVQINNRLDTIEGEIAKLNPESQVVFCK